MVGRIIVRLGIDEGGGRRVIVRGVVVFLQMVVGLQINEGGVSMVVVRVVVWLDELLLD